MTIIECPATGCLPMPSDLTTYNLQDAIFFNGTPLSFLVTCPAGYVCAPGSFPTTFTYPPGTFSFPIPPAGAGNPIILSMKGCSSTVTIVLPSTATLAEQNAAAQQIFNQVAAQQAVCDAIASLPPGAKIPNVISLSAITQFACVNVPFNATIFASATPSGAPYTMTPAPKPSWMAAAQTPTTLVLSGTPTTIGAINFTVTATGSSAYGTKAYTLNIVGIATASLLPDAIDGVLYGVNLDASSITGTQTWSVIAGSLPAWLNLNSVTGSLSGTPSIGDIGATSNFTLQVTNGSVTCSKAFSLTVNTTTCDFFHGIDWSPVTYFGNGAGVKLGNSVSVAATGGASCTFTSGIQGMGTLLYTGPEVTCSVNIVFTIGAVQSYVRFCITQDGTEILVWDDVDGPGTFYFTIAAGVASLLEFGGRPSVSPIFAYAGAGDCIGPGDPPAGSATMTVVIGNG